MRADRAGRICAGVREIIHTSILRRSVSAGMSETECMTDFLTHNVQSFVRIIVCAGVEIGVVHLGRTLRDMRSAQIDRSETEPAVAAVCVIAGMDFAQNHRTLASRSRRFTALFERQIHHRRSRPIGNRRIL